MVERFDKLNVPVGHLHALTGEAYIRDPGGNLRPLRLNEPVFSGEVVVTADGTRVELILLDTRTYVINANETLTIDAEVLAVEHVDASDAALLLVNESFDQLMRAIIVAGEKDELKAVVNGALSSGARFTRLLHVVENFAPKACALSTSDEPNSAAGGAPHLDISTFDDLAVAKPSA
ncbi:MAG: hypothetical protein V4623_08030 [Pseudomonadota bacterium]